MMIRTLCFCGVFWMLAGAAWADEKPLRDFIKQHCADCHAADEKKGDLDLTALKVDFTNADDFARWVKVYDRIASGEMPPKKAARPADAERAAFLGVLGKELATTESRTLVAGGGRTTVRRMNRVEYEHALRDLLALPLLRVKDLLPEDGQQFGFDKVAGALDISHIQMTKYLRLTAAGINVFVSSGDAGSNPDSSGHATGGPLQAEYAATDTAVTAVGGTALFLDAMGGVQSETGWVDGGGGTSRFFNRPAWQQGTGVVQNNFRQVPDVSLAADPNTGALVFFQGQPTQIGGTSWSAPVWAGFCALINEARAKNGKPALGFINPRLYPLMGTPAFRDITTGSNGAFHAGPGFDLVTGIGVPNIKELVNALKN